MSRISVRGFAVASATAVTAVGSVVGVASGSVAQVCGYTGFTGTPVELRRTMAPGTPLPEKASPVKKPPIFAPARTVAILTSSVNPATGPNAVGAPSALTKRTHLVFPCVLKSADDCLVLRILD